MKVLRIASLLAGIVLGAPLALAAGDLFLIGGGARTPELIDRIGVMAGGTEARIVVAPWATAEPASAIENLQKQFASFKPQAVIAAPFLPSKFDPEQPGGCKRLMAFHEPVQIFTRAETRKFIADLATATALYMTGGMQRRIMTVIMEEPEVGAAIRAFRKRGGLYIGTSAGTAAAPLEMLSGQVIRLENGSEMGLVEGGLGFLPKGVFVDQHFVQRARYDRLRNIVAMDPSYLGIGISESTAAIIRDDGLLEVIGESEVVLYFFEGFSREKGIRELRLKRGDVFDLKSRAHLKSA